MSERQARRHADAASYIQAASPRLMRLAWALTGNQHDAEDLLQDALTTVVVKWGRISLTTTPDAYVRRIMVNQHTSRLRLRRSGEVTSSDSTLLDRVSPSSTARVDDRDELLQLLWTLPVKQRTVLVLRYLEDLPDVEIAAIMGYRMGSVRGLASRALATLRRHLDEQAPPAVPAALHHALR